VASVLYNVVLPEIARILFPEMMIRALDYVYTSCTRTHTTVYSTAVHVHVHVRLT